MLHGQMIWESIQDPNLGWTWVYKVQGEGWDMNRKGASPLEAISHMTLRAS